MAKEPQKVLPQANYVPKAKGYPVEAGQDWRDLTMEQKREWFHQHENRWRDKFGQNAKMVSGSMNWTRG